jgi:hypothetical protein
LPECSHIRVLRRLPLSQDFAFVADWGDRDDRQRRHSDDESRALGSWQERIDEAPGSMFAQLFVRDLSLRYVSERGRRVRSLRPRATGQAGRTGYLVTFPLSPRYGLVRVYSVVSGASTTRTSLDVEVDCMPDRHRSAWRRCRLMDQVVRGRIVTFQGGGRPLPLAA